MRPAAHPALAWIAVPLGAGVIALLPLLTTAAALATLGALAAIGSGELVHVLTAVPAILAISVLFPGVMVLPTATLVSALGIVIARSTHGARVPRRIAFGIASLSGATYAVLSFGGLPRSVDAREALVVVVTGVVGAVAGVASDLVGRYLGAAAIPRGREVDHLPDPGRIEPGDGQPR